MRDGKTQVVKRAPKGDIRGFFEQFTAKLVAVGGQGVGAECSLESSRTTLGRGPGVDLVFKDEAMSRQHAAIVCNGDGFEILDLGSTNGLILDGQVVTSAELTTSSRIEIGAHVFQLVIEEREQEPSVYELPTEL